MMYSYSALLLSIFLLFLTGCQPHQEQQVAFNDSYYEATAQPAWYNPADFDTLKLLSWNVEHFVDDYDNPYTDNRRENDPPAEMEMRRELLAEALKIADADIVVLQEFESDSYAQQLAEDYFPELGYQVFAGHESNDWYMNVVVMSRVPLGMFYSYATTNTPIIGQTDDDGNLASQTFINNRMWTVDVLVNPEYDFSLTGVHLKAGRGERNENWRLGQMQLLHAHYERLLQVDRDQNILVAGDFNSTPDSREFLQFLNTGSQTEFIDLLAGTGTYSHPADSAFWRIDHILPNNHMAPEIVNGSVDVRYFFSPDSMNMIADHLPLEIEIITSEKR